VGRRRRSGRRGPARNRRAAGTRRCQRPLPARAGVPETRQGEARAGGVRYVSAPEGPAAEGIAMIAIVLAAVLSAADAPGPVQRGRPAPPATARPAESGTSRGALLERAAAALTAGRRSDAKALFTEAADRYGSVAALLALARLQAEDGDAAAGLASLQKARTLAPN